MPIDVDIAISQEVAPSERFLSIVIMATGQFLFANFCIIRSGV